ncbi:MAG: AI-2E family transporter, partial [Moraxella sp.]|nr:AI-2E family transporter [Moraxella sp.]
MTSQDSMFKFLVGMASLVVVVAGIKLASTLIVQFLTALFIVIICSPLINLLTRHRVPHWVAILVLFFIISLGLGFLGNLINLSITEFTRSIPEYERLLFTRLNEMTALAEKWKLPFEINTAIITEHLNAKSVFSFASSLMGGVSSLASSMFVLVLLVLFMLFEAKDFRSKLAYVLSHHKQDGFDNDKVSLILQSVIRYLGLKALISLFTGLCVWALLVVLDVQYAVLWATLCFLLNFVPNIGSVMAAIPVVLQAFLLNGFSIGASVMVGILLINIVIGNLLEPKIMGKNLGLSTLMVFLSLLFWGWLLGVVGMLLSVPLTMTLKIVLEANPKTAHYAVLMGDDTKETL